MKRKVAYVYSPDIENYNYGPDHPMKPKKVAMTNDIVEHSDLLHHMNIYVGLLETPAGLGHRTKAVPFREVRRLHQRLLQGEGVFDDV